MPDEQLATNVNQLLFRSVGKHTPLHHRYVTPKATTIMHRGERSLIGRY
jgi:hypothetical protein